MSVIPDTDDSTRTAAIGVRVFHRNMDIQPGATPTTSDPTTSGRSHPEPAGPTSVVLGAGPLSIDEVVAVARHGARIDLDGTALDGVAASRRIIEALASDPEPHYGISTGFGALATTFIEPTRRAQLQASLVRSHAAGSGEVVEREVVRSLMTLRLSTLMTGRTGVRVETVRAYAAMLNAGITPVVREYGSLGCSGDLAPLAHCALAVMGEGEVTDASGRTRSAAEALADAGLQPVQLAEKEGLALINGTDGMLGMLALAVEDLRMLLRTADVAAAMSVEGLLGTDAVFAADLQALRPQSGQAESAANLRLLLDGSPIVASHRGPECTRVQDAYSLRCAPQVHGAARDTVDHAAMVAERELASAVDNPVLTPDGRVESNGNFHGAPVAYVLDFLAIAVADVASMSERRTDRFLDRSRSNGLPPFLAHEVGVDSGLMIAQYTAAGIVSELKRLAHPASVDSIPSSAMQEDHVSMGWAAARKLRRAIDGLSRVLAIEVMTAARGLDLRGPLEPAVGTGAVLRRVREQVTGPGPDRFLSPEIEAVTALVQSGEVVRAVTGAVGDLR
ncbi:histidine ammonia-lyase [Plantibacter sp. VKM Ac-1784]|uniref:Histidine ammonia-lyase n=1 Tax=Plantibacter elymi (nom. nud.) TaxID=199708 RepID=A0ABY1RF93_9MICO|nr:histidine ammonia-lyase [Plantibacter sp. VKM Ac-1784]SMQ72708.1 histidine ammonia-lyase [Plantibacter sp. VKM Ac-1784]